MINIKFNNKKDGRKICDLSNCDYTQFYCVEIKNSKPICSSLKLEHLELINPCNCCIGCKLRCTVKLDIPEILKVEDADIFLMLLKLSG